MQNTPYQDFKDFVHKGTKNRIGLESRAGSINDAPLSYFLANASGKHLDWYSDRNMMQNKQLVMLLSALVAIMVATPTEVKCLTMGIKFLKVKVSLIT